MKINKFTKTISSVFLGAFIAAGFTGCMNPIFHYIKEEVKLEEMKIHGDIYSFARIGEDSNAKIFVSNGKIYWKEASKEGHGGWTEFKKPEGQVYTIASDESDNLYAVTFISSKYDSDGEMKVTEKRLYACSAADGDWTQIDSISIGEDSLKDVYALMGTNSFKKEHRKAFINIRGTGYKLENRSKTAYSEANGKKSCAYLDGVKFYTGNAACSNKDDTLIYYADGSTLKATGTLNGESVTDEKIASGVRSTINGIAVCEGSVLINTNSGAALVNGTSGSEITWANLTSTLSTLYEGRACIIVDPSKTYDKAICYAGLTVEGTGSNSALFTHEGLWSYYPSRGKWNVE